MTQSWNPDEAAIADAAETQTDDGCGVVLLALVAMLIAFLMVAAAGLAAGV